MKLARIDLSARAALLIGGAPAGGRGERACARSAEGAINGPLAADGCSRDGCAVCKHVRRPGGARAPAAAPGRRPGGHCSFMRRYSLGAAAAAGCWAAAAAAGGRRGRAGRGAAATPRRAARRTSRGASPPASLGVRGRVARPTGVGASSRAAREAMTLGGPRPRDRAARPRPYPHRARGACAGGGLSGSPSPAAAMRRRPPRARGRR